MMRLDNAMRYRIWQQFKVIADSIKAMAQSLVPVKTGFLRSTIYASMDPPSPFGITEKHWILKVGAWARYARYQEFGTRYIQPKEFLTKSLQAHQPSLVALMHAAISEAIAEGAIG